MAKSKTKPVIFISHISKEASLADVLKKHITRDFLNLAEVFVSSDTTSIGVGRKWLDDVTDALKKADIEIVLCSKESVQRPWINFEAGGAWVKGIPIVPVCHTDTKLLDLPVPLNMLEAIEASTLDGMQKLYTSIVELLHSDPPRKDFTDLINEIKEVETQYRNERLEKAMQEGTPPGSNPFPDVRRILKPKILCASSTMYEELGYQKDIEIIEKYFPGQVTVQHNVVSKTMRDLLIENKFDIIHILAHIGKDGKLLFVNNASELNSEKKADCITAEGFAALINISKTSLVVLASCNSLPLAASLNKKTNFIASMDNIAVDPTLNWEDCFYGFLSKGYSVQKAYDLSKSLHTLPMLLIPSADIAFAPER